MNYNSLRYFLKLAELEHYTNAAKELFISQPSLSYAITKLEEELGVILFEKDGRNVRLTESGKILYDHTSPGFSKIHKGIALIQQTNRIDSPVISVASLFLFDSTFFTKMIESFSANSLYSNVTFMFGQGNTSFVVDGLKKGHYDIGIASFANDEPTLQFTSILQQPFILITSIEHPLASRESVSISEILEYPLVTYNRQTTGHIRRLLDKIFEPFRKEANIICEFEDERPIASMVQSNNINVAIVPDVSVLDTFELKKTPITNVNLCRDLYLMRVKGRFLNEASETFYNFLCNYPWS